MNEANDTAKQQRIMHLKSMYKMNNMKQSKSPIFKVVEEEEKKQFGGL